MASTVFTSFLFLYRSINRGIYKIMWLRLDKMIKEKEKEKEDIEKTEDKNEE